MRREVQAFLIAAGLVVVALLGLVAVWKLTKSVVSVVFWLAVLTGLALGAWWLLAQYGILPPLSFPGGSAVPAAASTLFPSATCAA